MNLFLSCLPVVGPAESDPEYQLIVDSNNLVVELDNEISKLDADRGYHGPCLRIVCMHPYFSVKAFLI